MVPFTMRGALRLLLVTGLAIAAIARAEAPAATDPHAQHRLMMGAEGKRSVASYQAPDVELVRDDGKTVRFLDELNDGRPVVLTFIYTSCTTVCPLLSHTQSQLQSALGADAARTHLMSVSIDPEQDTPARLREHARTYHAGPGWQFYTGTLAASQTVQRAFNVYRGNKMDHSPATLIRLKPGSDWIRFDGFATAEQLRAELADFKNGELTARQVGP